ncbi:COX15/CtaA family protein [Brevibacillus borstelensis]|uniref:COX15/CtaA family protein n=1 Tax=Brevibacillus borstelensis TaxID=45462 RepID=UPI00046AA9DE|nr:heme A synthase [Brevibacillus borstelensis]MED1874430.1 heme A synthase [Brevibacillus borstelensis]WNF06616.1 heme A synthase [Brevibacillus borstelensis]
MDKWLKWFAIASTIITFMVMIGGSLVTKTDSGLGCGNDWPLCNGRWVPEYTLESMIEYMHRFVTGMTGIIVGIFSILAWRRYPRNREVRGLVMFSMFFLILESFLGASAVIWPQSSAVMALHFGFSLLAFSGVLLLSIFVLQRNKVEKLVRGTVSKGFQWAIWIVTIYAYGVVYLGAYVRHTGSNLGCSDWPLCQGKLIPELSGQTGIHFMHRVAAIVLAILLAAVLVYVLRHFKETRRDLYGAGILSFVLVVIQVLSGGWVVLSRLTLYSTIFHSAVITCLFGTMCYMCLQSLKAPEKGTKRQQQ